jgi:hypothetical protein
MRKKEPQPERPSESKCKRCGATVYVISNMAGQEISLDVKPLEISTIAEMFYGRTLPARWVSRQLSLAWQELTACRRRFRHPAVSLVGGYRFLEPRWFYGTDTHPPAWLWFGDKVELETAYRDHVAIHAEHYTTCEAMDRRRLLAELTALHLEGSATGDRRPYKMKLLNLRAERERVEAHAVERGETVDEFAHHPATDPRLKTVGRSEDEHQIQC